MKNLSFKYLLFFILFALLGFSREFIFVNLNDRLYTMYYGHEESLLPNGLQFIKNYSYNTIYYSKYVLTILYFLAYGLASYMAINIICSDKPFAKWVIYLYLFIVVISGITMLYNYFINEQLDGDNYLFSRWLMGIAQSPLIVFFMIASHLLYKKMKLS